MGVAADPMPVNVSDAFIILKPRDQWPYPELPRGELVRRIEEKVAGSREARNDPAVRGDAAHTIRSLIGSIPLIFITDQTSMVWISLILFIRGTSVGGISLPLTSEAYTGLGSEQLPEAGVGINIIENLGSSFGSAVVATVVATVALQFPHTIAGSLESYHAGFLLSAVVLVLIFIPGLLLAGRKTDKQTA